MIKHWHQVLAVCPLCFFSGGLYGWSALIAPLQTQFGVSTAQTGLVFSLAIVCFTAAVVGAPHVLGGWHALQRVAVFGVGAACTLILALTAPSYSLFVLWFSGGFGTLSGAIYIASVTIAAQSAVHRKATPVMVASFGLGGAVLGPFWRASAEVWGLSAIWPLVVGLAISSGLIWILPRRKTPSSAGTHPIANPHRSPPHVTLVLIWLTFALGSFGGLMVLGLAAKMLDVANAPTGLASLALAGIALGNTGGRLSVAGITQYHPPILAVFASLAVGIAGLALILSMPGAITLAFGLCAVAVGYGIMASAIPTLIRTTFGADRFQTKFALVFLAWGCAGFFAPWIGGAIFDQNGDFDRALGLALIATLACLGITMALHRALARL